MTPCRRPEPQACRVARAATAGPRSSPVAFRWATPCAWAVRPVAVAVVVFTGTAGTLSAGRPEVTGRLACRGLRGTRPVKADGPGGRRAASALAAAGRVAIQAPGRRRPDRPGGRRRHRVNLTGPKAFGAARFAIGTVRESVPVGKRERAGPAGGTGALLPVVVSADQVGANQVGFSPLFHPESLPPFPFHFPFTSFRPDRGPLVHPFMTPGHFSTTWPSRPGACVYPGPFVGLRHSSLLSSHQRVSPWAEP